MTAPARLRKSYSAPYVVDKGKLSRMLTLIEHRLTELQQPFEPVFAIKFASGRQLKLRLADEVFALDNPVANPIRDLSVGVSSREGSVSISFDSSKHSNIELEVSSANAKWTNDLFAELEEQIDRTLSRSPVQRYLLADQLSSYTLFSFVIGALALIFMFGQLFVASSPPFESLLLQRARAAKTDHDRLQVVFDKTVHDLSEAEQKGSPSIDWAKFLTWRVLFIALPVLILVVTIAYLLRACYPWSVFAWGDYEQYYSELISRRRTLWTVVVVSIVVGVISNLFVASLPPTR